MDTMKTKTKVKAGATFIGSSIVIDGEILGEEDLVSPGTVKG
jgi:hypothetical protein